MDLFGAADKGASNLDLTNALSFGLLLPLEAIYLTPTQPGDKGAPGQRRPLLRAGLRNMASS